MIRRPIVFSVVRDQAIFLTSILALLSFLAILAFGITIGIGSGVAKWNARWDKFATIQVLPNGNFDAAVSLAKTAKKMTIIPDSETADMLRPVLGSGDALQKHIPKMIEVEFRNKSEMQKMGAAANKLERTRFITYADGARNITRAGWQIMGISVLVMLMVLGAIGVCIMYITRNLIMIHHRELEILTQIGASDSFVANQMQRIVLRLSLVASGIGLVAAALMIMIIIAMAHGTRIGLMAQMYIPDWGWGMIVALPTLIIALTIWLAQRTTLHKLANK
ncbi:MAG: hypothetical protein LBL75_00155 [Rickettsiales bacterium]|jgi:cell division transport system permease protein|nr:hypothetical protein [Rickettsiales bacterium]